jgi:hypothetical protein
MGIDFGALIVDLETLASSSKEDFNNEFWSSYEDYLKTYNKILNDMQTLGFFKTIKPINTVPLSEQSFDSGFSKQEKAKLRKITTASDSLLKKVKLLLSPPANYRPNNEIRSNKVFLVHSQDNEMKNDVTQTLQKLDLEPITPDPKQTLIEKPSDYTHITFAVVLISPDETTQQPNQNTILELGYLLGRLGKQNVVAIYKKQKGFQIPNNYNGVTWIEYKHDWYFKLIKELQNAKFDVDANKLSWL